MAEFEDWNDLQHYTTLTIAGRGAFWWTLIEITNYDYDWYALPLTEARGFRQ